MGIMSLISRLFGGEDAAGSEGKTECGCCSAPSSSREPREKSSERGGRENRERRPRRERGERNDRFERNDRSERGERQERVSTPGAAVSVKELESFVEYVAKALVDYPYELSVATRDADGSKQIMITCRATDRGKIIGRKGKTIIALRALVAGAAGRTQERVSVEIVDDENSLNVKKSSQPETDVAGEAASC